MTPQQIGEAIPHGPDPEPYIASVQSFIDAGFDKLAIVPIGDDLSGTLDFWETEVRPNLKMS